MRGRTMTLTLAAVAMAIVVGAVPATAMQAGSMMIASADEPSTERAHALRAQAEELFSKPSQWRRAARLLEQSAQLRSADDPGAYTCWMNAARLQAGMGSFSAARRNLEKAAAHAVARGEVVDAANAYIDAAHVAVKEGQAHQAVGLIEKASLLASSPLLDGEQAARINARIPD
ncbi:hypothetical protein BH23GEM9_BH23GEM9_16150 [soil metagenome]